MQFGAVAKRRQIGPFVRAWLGVGLALAMSDTSVAGQEGSSVLPGSSMVKGSSLAPYDASWQSRGNQGGEWQDQGVITETMTLEGDRWVRIQVTHRQGWGTRTRVEMDRTTLRPLLLRRSLLPDTPSQVVEQLKGAGFMKEFEMRFEGSTYETHTETFDGETGVERGDVGTPFFDGSVLGLVIAALPLDTGSEARIPILFVDGRAGGVTPYWVEASVRGTEVVEGKEAIRVDVGWAEWDSGVISSAPGPDAAGGAYWITPNSGGAVPPVPRYRNESFDVLVSESGEDAQPAPR